MDYFSYKQGKLFCEDVNVSEIVSETGSPVYIYSQSTLLSHFNKIKKSFSELNPLICYSIKANSNGRILSLLHGEGAGFDAVSGGEIYRAIQAGGTPEKIVYAGVGKTDSEIEYALNVGIYMFNVESEMELYNIERIACKLDKNVNVALRINPDVDPQTHKYITTGKSENKFGIDMVSASKIFENSKELKKTKIIGLHMHIGSQITKIEPYIQALNKIAAYIEELRGKGFEISHLNMGGGFGIFYKDKTAKTPDEFAKEIIPIIKKVGCQLLLEPGRFIVGNAGILVTKVSYLKHSGDIKAFVICDAGMNDLIRPSLYSAYHKIWPIETEESINGDVPDEDLWDGAKVTADIVGPICESGDFFAKDRAIPKVRQGDFISVFSAGAYGYTMSSNYNSHLKPPEILVSGDKYEIVSRRETFEDLIRLEKP